MAMFTITTRAVVERVYEVEATDAKSASDASTHVTPASETDLSEETIEIRVATQTPESEMDQEGMAGEIIRLRTALECIRECMGGDRPSDGWETPEDVWGIATKALGLEKPDQAK